MATFWRRLGSAEPARVSALVLGVALLPVPAAYAFAAAESSVSPGALAAGLALLAVAGSGLLYASRPGPGGLGD